MRGTVPQSHNKKKEHSILISSLWTTKEIMVPYKEISPHDYFFSEGVSEQNLQLFHRTLISFTAKYWLRHHFAISEHIRICSAFYTQWIVMLRNACMPWMFSLFIFINMLCMLIWKIFSVFNFRPESKTLKSGKISRIFLFINVLHTLLKKTKEDFLTKALSLATIVSCIEAVELPSACTWHLMPVHFFSDCLVP